MVQPTAALYRAAEEEEKKNLYNVACMYVYRRYIYILYKWVCWYYKYEVAQTQWSTF